MTNYSVASRRHLASVTFHNPTTTFNVFVDRIATEKDCDALEGRIKSKLTNLLIEGCHSTDEIAGKITESVTNFMLENNKISVERMTNQ